MGRSAITDIAVIMVLVVLCTGCASISDNPKTAIGGLGGAATGGLIAAAAGGGGAGIAAGVIGGALLGGLIGNMLDQRDKEMQAKAASQALESSPSGKSVPWHNPDTGHAGTVTPTRTYQTAQGTYCREYQQTVTIDGKQENSYGTACRQPDGSWKIAN
jgi:surface antigen